MSSTDEDVARDGRLDYDAIVRTVGLIEPWKITAILALGASIEELEQAAAWVSVEDDESGLRHESAGDAATEARVAAIYEIMVSDRAEAEA